MQATCQEDATHKQFFTAATVSEVWKVTDTGSWLETQEGDGEVIHQPTSDNIWTCAICGAEATVVD